MPFCRHCGHGYEGVAKFCPECGQPQEEGMATGAVRKEQPAPPDEGSEQTIWEGESRDLTNRASGGRLVSCRYRVTDRALYFDEGLITTTSQQIPLWAVRDIDVKQGMFQRARGVGDVTVRVEHSDYTGRNTIELRDIEGPADVRDLLNHNAQRERLDYQQRQQTRYYGR